MPDSAVLSSPEVRAMARELALLRRDVDSIREGERATQMDYSSIMGPLYVRDPVTGDFLGTVGLQPDGGVSTIPVGGPAPPGIQDPILTPDIHTIIVEWNGAFAGGVARPTNFAFVAVHASQVGPNFITDPSNLVATLSEAGKVPIGPYEGPVWVRFVGYNTSTPPVTGPASGTVSATPEQVVAQAVLDGIVTETKLADQAVAANKVKLAAIGTAQIAGNAVTLSQLANGSVDATKLIGDAVTSPAIAASAVTTSELAANSVVAGKVAADSITANELAANSVGADQLVAGAVQAGKIAAGAVTANEIAALAITAGKVAANAITAGAIAAGAVTAAKLESILSISNRFLAGSATGTRAEMTPTGFEAWNGSLQTFDVDAATGAVMMLGTYKSAASGNERVEIVQDGTMRFFAAGAGSGTYAEIQNTGGALRMRGVLNGGNAANIQLDSGSAGFNYGVPGGTTLTGAGVSGNFFGVIASFAGLRLNGRVAPDANGRRYFLLRTNSSGSDIGSTLVQYSDNNEATPRGSWNSPTNNCGITWGGGEIWITPGGLSGFGPIAASVFNVNSSVEAKDGITEAVFPEQRTSWDVVEGAPTQEWDYIEEMEARPEKPVVAGEPVRLRVRNPDISDYKFQTLPDTDPNKWVWQDAEWTTPPRSRRRHRFPVAEDLVALGSGVVSNATGEGIDSRVDLRDMVGILWDAVDMLIKRNRVVEDRLMARFPVLALPGRPQKGDVVEGVGAVVAGRTRRIIDAQTGQIRNRITRAVR